MEQFVTSRTVLPGPASVLHLVSSYTPHGVNVRSSQNRTGPEEWAQHFPKTKTYYFCPLMKVTGQNDARDLGVREKKVKEQAAPRVCLFSLYISIELCVLLPKLGKAGCGKFGRSAHMIVESVRPCSTSVV